MQREAPPRTAVPALGLAVAGILACAGPLVVRLDLGSGLLAAIRDRSAYLLSLGPVFGLAFLWGAFCLWRLESFTVARWSCILALLPCSVALPISAPAGIWGLVVLKKPKVQTAFRRRAVRYRADLERALDDYDADLRGPED